MQQVDVQCVALDPFSAVKQPPQRADGLAYLDSEGVFHGVACAHLVGHGANPADARGDVRHFAEFPAAQECFKEARRLEDLQLHLGDLPVFDLHKKSAFAFDARQIFDFDGPIFHALRSLSGKARRRH